MCGREPNFELSEEEKQELRKFNWDEFLTITRSAITNKSKFSAFLKYLSVSITLNDLESLNLQKPREEVGLVREENFKTMTGKASKGAVAYRPLKTKPRLPNLHCQLLFPQFLFSFYEDFGIRLKRLI